MSKEFKNTDDLFQSIFVDDELEVPAFVKSNIDKHLESKKPKIIWIWLSILIILIGSSVIAFVVHNANQSTPANTLETSITQQNTTQNDQDIKENKSYQQTSFNEIKDSSVKENITVNDLENISTSEKNKNLDIPEKYADAKPIPDFNVSTNNNSSNDKKGETTFNNEVKRTNNFSSSSSQLSPIKKYFSNTPANYELPFKPARSIFAELSYQNSAKLSQQHLFGDMTEAPQITIQQNNSGNNAWMFIAAAGPKINRAFYTSDNSELVTIYENDNDEKLTWEAGLDAKYFLKNSLTFGTGIAVSNLKQNYAYFKQSQQIDTIYNWNYFDIYEYDSIADTMVFVGIDSTLQTEYDTTSVINYNQSGTNEASYLHIPISLGYSFGYKKFIFDLFIQGRFNYLLKGSGVYLNNDSITTFTKSDNVYRKWFIDLRVGLSTHYKLTDHLFLTGNFYSSPVKIANYQGLNFEKYSRSFSATLGLSWKL